MLKSTTIYLNIDRIVLYVTSEKTPVMEKWFWPRKEKDARVEEQNTGTLLLLC